MNAQHRLAVEHAATATFYEYMHGARAWQILLPHPATYELADETERMNRIATLLERYIGFHIAITQKGTTSFSANDEMMTSVDIELDYRTTAMYAFQFESDHVNITVIIYRYQTPVAVRKILDIRDIRNLENNFVWELFSR